MMEALSSSETSVLTRATRRNIPEDAILHNIINFQFNFRPEDVGNVSPKCWYPLTRLHDVSIKELTA
jgi:hypothetical protein